MRFLERTALPYSCGDPFVHISLGTPAETGICIWATHVGLLVCGLGALWIQWMRLRRTIKARAERRLHLRNAPVARAGRWDALRSVLGTGARVGEEAPNGAASISRTCNLTSTNVPDTQSQLANHPTG